MKNFKLLSRAEMKSLAGGESCPAGYIECEDGTCIIPEESSCGSGGGVAGPKVKACEGKNEGDACSFMYNGAPSTGFCRSYAPNYIRHCSNLM